MTKVTNNYTSSLRLGDTEVPAKGSAEVADWASLRNNGVISRWLDSGILSVSDSDNDSEVLEDVEFTEEVAEPSQAEVEDALDQLSEDEEKESLIEQLAGFGVKADKRSSVEKLQEKLDEALAK